jgi:DNA-binding Xre family transcriptional regulator
MKVEAPENLLGPYLTKKGKDSVEICEKTGIPIGSIRKMRSGETKAIPAIELYKISLVTKDSISNVLKEVYKNLKLNATNKVISTHIKADTTELGKVIFALEDYDLNNLAYRTGIKRDRLHRLTKLDTSKIQSHELYLIEMASDKETGELFANLFKDVSL